MFIIILNPFFYWLFTIDQYGLSYNQIMSRIVIIIAYFYILFQIGYVIYYRKSLPRNKTFSLIIFSIIMIISVVLRAFSPKTLLELFGHSISLLIILITIDDLNELTNENTKLLNKEAFLKDMMICWRNTTELTIVAVKIAKTNFYYSSLGYDNMSKLLYDIAQFLKEINKKIEVYDCTDGDFTLVIKNIEKIDPELIMKKIKKKFLNPWICNEMKLKFSLQICRIDCPKMVNSIEEILVFLKLPVNLEKNKIEVINYVNLIESQLREIAIEDALMRGLENNSFHVYYQPIIDVKRDKVISVEALLRLEDPILGSISPEEFIPIAEKRGTIINIGKVVLEEVSKMISQKDIREYGLFCIQVNLSVVQCMQNGFKDEIMKILSKYNLETKQIIFEITETAATNMRELIEENMHGLNGEGIEFALDDFGTGYSNITFLLELPFNYVKLDKSLIWLADKSESANIVMENQINMIKALGLKIVAEGIETEAQVAKLKALDCDYFQGYYYSRPIPEEEMLKFVKNYNSQ